MKINCNQSDLLKALLQVSAVTEKKTTMPILGNILLEVSGDILSISGTDLEISVISSCKVDCIKEGKICTPASSLVDIIKRLPKPDVSLHTDKNGWLNVHSGKANFKIASVDPAEFPKLPNQNDFNIKKIQPKTLLKGIQRTSFAMSTDEMRPNLNGILFEVENKNIKMVATDGHRLSMHYQSLENSEDFTTPNKIIVPRKGILELKKLLQDTDQELIKIGLKDNNIIFCIDNATIFMKLVVGDFPDYQAVIPKGERKKLVVHRGNFSDSLKRVSLLSDGKSKCIKLGIEPSKINLAANSPELGEAEEEIQGEFEGKDLLIGFNAKYLLDTLSVLDSDQIVFELDHDQSPGVFKIPNDSSFTGVIMPMRI